ncbi:MAG TPA: hypothetical protein VFF06_29010 [Polyangia bacterium]|nr:hypothetical protein [Polyangia bacterium]
MKRLALPLVLALSFARPALADEVATTAALAPRGAAWYAGWSLIVAGGATAITGCALTTRADLDASGAQVSGLSAQQTAGWVMVGLGTLSWVGGALTLKFGARRAKR